MGDDLAFSDRLGYQRSLDDLLKQVEALGVQSRGQMVWVLSEAVWLEGPCFADSFVGCEACESLESFGEVVGVEEGREVGPELLVGAVVITPDGRFLERPVHPLDLTVGPGMVGLREAVLDPVLEADRDCRIFCA